MSYTIDPYRCHCLASAMHSKLVPQESCSYSLNTAAWLSVRHVPNHSTSGAPLPVNRNHDRDALRTPVSFEYLHVPATNKVSSGGGCEIGRNCFPVLCVDLLVMHFRDLNNRNAVNLRLRLVPTNAITLPTLAICCL
jgi:hypothetical protein